MKYTKEQEKIQKKIQKELEAIAFTRIADICTWGEGGITLIPNKTIKGVHTAVIAEIKEDAKGIHIKLHSKLKALELLQKYYEIEDKAHSTENKEVTLLPESIKILLGEKE